MDHIRIYDGQEIRRLEGIANKSSDMVSWYSHPYDGTIRGGHCRWFKCIEGVKDGPIASVFDDTTFAAEALNNFAPMIKQIKQLKSLVSMGQRCLNTAQYRQLYREAMQENCDGSDIFPEKTVIITEEKLDDLIENLFDSTSTEGVKELKRKMGF